jgi:hypothetical protein
MQPHFQARILRHSYSDGVKRLLSASAAFLEQ